MIEQKYERKVIARYKDLYRDFTVDVTCVRNDFGGGEGYVVAGHKGSGWEVGEFFHGWPPFDDEDEWVLVETAEEKEEATLPQETTAERIARLKKELAEAEEQLKEESQEKEREVWVAVSRGYYDTLNLFDYNEIRGALEHHLKNPRVVGLHKVTLKAVIEEE